MALLVNSFTKPNRGGWSKSMIHHAPHIGDSVGYERVNQMLVPLLANNVLNTQCHLITDT